MIEFSVEQKKAIEQKMELFHPISEPGIPQNELLRRLKLIEEEIISKRLNWYEENKNGLYYLKWSDLHDIEKTINMIFGHYMKIDPDEFDPKNNIHQVYNEENGILICYIQTRTFCPYKEAFRLLKIKPKDSVKLCKIVLEKPVQLLVDKINPKIQFFRNYSCIRPIADYCDERLIVRDFSFVQNPGYEYGAL